MASARAKPAEILPTKIVYLLGAGATHAELVNIRTAQMSAAPYEEQNSLLLASVSKRVCREVQRSPDMPRSLLRLLSRDGLSNVELFTSLLEENRIDSSARIVEMIKAGIRKDILGRLRNHQRYFYLHKALFEFHVKYKRETLTGVISLNYDRLVDDAYEVIFRRNPNYCFSPPDEDRKAIPLLKLHGGFGLTYRTKTLAIITPGIRKNYLVLPYNFVWGRALEILMECDVLRIIGCSLSQNDAGIIDLLFKAHVGRRNAPTLQLINFDPVNNPIKAQLGFFPKVEPAEQIEGRLITDGDIKKPYPTINPFKIWLKAKIKKALTKDQIRRTKFAKLVFD